MRITNNMMFNQFIRSMQGGISDLADLNTQLYSGKKINKPSDDVIGSVNAMDYKVEIDLNEQYKTNINSAGIYLDFNDKAMTTVSDILGNLKTLAQQSVNPMSQSERDVFSRQAADYRDFLLSVSNSKIGERYVFSGYKTDERAFEYNAVTNKYDYNGDLGEIKVPIDKEADISVNIQGSRAFSISLRNSMPTTLLDGTPVNYTEATDAAGITTVTVEIGNAGDPDFDTFTYSNVMDMANIVSNAWQYKDIDGTDINANPTINETMALRRMSALMVPFDDAINNAMALQAEVGTRQIEFRDQTARLTSYNTTLKNSLSKTEDADITETAVNIKQAELALEALRSSSSTLISKSLFDFLQ